MKNIFLKLVISATLLIASTSTFATPLNKILGSMQFTGVSSVTDNGSQATSIAFTSNTYAWLGTQDLAAAAAGPTLVIATFAPIWNINIGTITQLWKVGDFSFEVTSIMFNQVDASGANNVTANGTVSSLSGAYLDTAAVFEWNQTATGTTFQANAVPAPATIALLGLALVGFGAARRKKQA
jgi:hypothetical protein